MEDFILFVVGGELGTSVCFGAVLPSLGQPFSYSRFCHGVVLPLKAGGFGILLIASSSS